MRNYLYRVSLIFVAVIMLQMSSVKVFGQAEKEVIPFKGYLYVQPNIGISQYFGDLNKKDFWNQNPKFAFGAVLGYQLSPVFGVRGQFVQRKNGSE